MNLDVTTFQRINGSTLTQCRRWVRDALPPEDGVKMRGGFKRTFSVTDGFLVHVFGWLQRTNKATAEEARILIDTLRPWVEKNMPPINNHKPPLDTNWSVYAWRTGAGGFLVEARGVMNTHKKKISSGFEYEEVGVVHVISGDKKVSQAVDFAAGAHVIFPISTWAVGFWLGLNNPKAR